MGWSGAATRTVVRGLVVAIALAALGAAWTISSPIGSSPDDDFHLGSIWCSAWAPKATCVPTDPPVFTTIRSVLIPEAVSESAICYRRHPLLSGYCPLSTDTSLLSRSRTNDGEYPGGYYEIGRAHV